MARRGCRWWLAVWLMGCGQVWGNPLPPLMGWLNGDFSSRTQAEEDRRFEAAELHARTIWPHEGPGYWLYLEQSLVARPAHPFRQRIFHLTDAGRGELLMVEYTMPKATDFAGAWRDPTKLRTLTPEQLSRRAGCELRLRRLPSGHYEGRNEIGRCPTNFAGADTLVQYIWIGPEHIRLLDRAYDQQGTLRWGSPGEGYVYLRVTP
ncbi:chromophore lyase CpcT/CpeT [Aeromonas schubertii]|uniref:chromophore lyase CpcT/CpeT n=1 Tax=Aeromonas schubertii TaxID=652 RepID=UPI001CC40E76|nr:chromophore lyase CpcT/CpeT [Aeromonas schubertii]MBZ6073468.1 chromophore lyase CpcT/CpeT [Aeromonas schubertii]